MDEIKCNLYDKVGHVKQRVEILHSTLLAVYVAGKESVYDAEVYLEAVHGSVEQAREAVEGLREILDILREETS